MKKDFHHIGLPAPDQDTPTPGESWVAGGRLWVSNPAHHPQRVEWLRYPPDTLVDPAMQSAPHICYLTDDIDAALDGKQVIREINEVGEPPFGRAAFTMEDGVAVEYIQLYPGRAWFDDDLDDADGGT